ncbi:MAG: Type-1 restriction enzyme MjaXIP specificity protein [Methanosaeta sp. PtaU1.Bin112]|nr:MAG: Type-1 restriction enzyme MjaXIP specificity protein [Methanosaeta sp. PtaU1.Bin112]
MTDLVEPIYGGLPDNWSLTTIKELVLSCDADIQTGPFGTMLHAESYVPSGTPVVAVKHLGDNRLLHEDLPRISPDDCERLSRYALCEGDIVFGRKGAVERRAYIKSSEEGWLQGSDCIRVRFNRNNISPKYISYVLGSSAYRKWIERNAQGATMPSLNQEIIGRIPLPIPPLPEQRAIARILGSLDDKIELNRRMNETLEAIARAIFKSWFVDFDPVRAKAEGREPAGMDAETAGLFPDSFEETELGLVPKGWRVGSFEETIELIGGGTPKTSNPEYWNGDIPWFSIVDAPRNGDVFVIDTMKMITKRGIEDSSARLLPRGTTIISARGTIGKCALVGVEMAMNQSCYGIRGKDNRGNYFTFFAVRNLVSELQRSTHGSVFDTITRETFIRVKSIIVPFELTQKFDEKISSFMERIIMNLQESKNLIAIRDFLLPKLISGELVNDCSVAKEVI